MGFTVSLWVLPQTFAAKGAPVSGTHKKPVWDGRKAVIIPIAKYYPDVTGVQPTHVNENPNISPGTSD